MADDNFKNFSVGILGQNSYINYVRYHQRAVCFDICHCMKPVLSYPSGNHITIGSCESSTSYTAHKSSTASNANHISINKYDYSIQIPFSPLPKMEILAPILISPLLGSPGLSPHLRDLFNISRQACQQGYPTQKVYEFIIEISHKFSFFLLWQQWSDQVTYLHMSWQLSCHDMCKTVTWSGHYHSSQSNMNFYKFGNMRL